MNNITCLRKPRYGFKWSNGWSVERGDLAVIPPVRHKKPTADLKYVSRVSDASLFDSVAAAIGALQEYCFYAASGKGFSYNTGLSLVRVEEIPGTTIPEKIERVVISESEVCGEKEVKWGVQIDPSGFGFETDYMAGATPGPNGTVTALSRATLFDTVAAACGRVEEERKARGSCHPAQYNIVPVAIRRTGGGTTPLTLKVTELR